MSDDPIAYDWDQFEEYCKLLAEKIDLSKGAAIAVLMTSSEDGVYISRMLEHFKNEVPFELNYESVGKGVNATFELIGPFPPGLNNRLVYLVSGAAFYGRKLRQAAKDLQDHGSKVLFVVIHCFRESKIKPHIHLFEVEGKIRDILHPWDNNKG
ncbi:MAG: hypothetical protein CO141_02060 [Candidatus Moranbacteria bacterium CG_4_9_14_3_um_filter_42_9]|nr:MAG: hypothetical protein CO141_02060 [Candidatus Moranbacteria bacterium CG_4_9_14_3_um_filter_42_9]